MTASPRKEGFNYAVNGFRGVCVLLVFLFHAEEGSHAIITTDALGKLGAAVFDFMTTFKFGVEMFFMISGYVIIGSLRKHATVKSFFIDRVLRIYPAWTPLHIMSFIIGPFMARGLFEHIDRAHWLLFFFTNLLFLSPVPFSSYPMAYSMSWSLSYEWTFYWLAGACIFLLRGSLNKHIIALLVGIASATIINLYPRALFFIPGVIMALNEDKFKPYARYFCFPVIALVTFLLAWAATGVDAAEIGVMLIEWFRDSRILFALLAFCAGLYMFAAVVLGAGWLTRILCSPMPQFLGKISYSFYLWHIIVMYPVKRFGIHFITPHMGMWAAVFFFTLVSFILSLVVSWLSWQYLEIRLGKAIKQALRINNPQVREPKQWNR